MLLDGKIAVVTGGGSGIGAATVTELSRIGAKPITWDVAVDSDFRCDVSDPAQVADAMQKTTEMYGTPTVLVACAGVGALSRGVVDIPIEDLDRTFAVNTYGVLLCLQAVARELIAQELEGSVVVVSSVNSIVADEGLGAYSMSKAATNMLVRVAAHEMGTFGIRVNAVAPGPTDTPMLSSLTANAEYLAEVAHRTPLGRVGTPDSVALAIVGLLAADWVTGQVLAVDGGSSLFTGRTTW
jgi:NAD(P)-dependent dehydrogenase (short-subunit alcohol dehydrogenase family)